MKRSIQSILLVAVGLGFAAQANAYSDHDRIERRQQKQEIRIERGIENRDLTQKEVRRLKREQREISQLRHLLETDGHLSRCERQILGDKLDLAGQNIRELRHNDRRRHARHEYDGHRESHHKPKARYDRYDWH